MQCWTYLNKSTQYHKINLLLYQNITFLKINSKISNNFVVSKFFALFKLYQYINNLNV